MLYSCWRESFPELHDEGYGSGGQRLRLFAFGPLDGPHSIDKEHKRIVFDNLANFEVRSPNEDLLDELAVQLAKRRYIRLGSQTLELCNLECRDRLIFPKRALVRMRPAVTTHRTVDDEGHTEFIGPDNPSFLEMCRRNSMRKMSTMGIERESTLDIVPLKNTIRKRVMRFKGTLITAWSGKLVLEASPEEMAILYHVGLGDRNSQGFGMFDIEEEPLRTGKPGGLPQNLPKQ